MDLPSLTSWENEASPRPGLSGLWRERDVSTSAGSFGRCRENDEPTRLDPSGFWGANDAPTRPGTSGFWRGAACSLAAHALLICALLAGGLPQEGGMQGDMGGGNGTRVAMVDLTGGDPKGGGRPAGEPGGSDEARPGRDGTEEKAGTARMDHVPKLSSRPAERESSIQNVMETAQPRTKKPRSRQVAAAKRPRESEARFFEKEESPPPAEDDIRPREQVRDADAPETKFVAVADEPKESGHGATNPAGRADSEARGQSAMISHGTGQGASAQNAASPAGAIQGGSGQGGPALDGAEHVGRPGGANRAGTGHNGVAAGHGGGEPGLFSLAEVESKPRLIRQIDPDYPESARKRGLTGKVTLRIVVDERGNVHSPAVTSADPAGVFDQCVLDAIVRWRFEPARRQGRCVAVVVTVPVRFDLASR